MIRKLLIFCGALLSMGLQHVIHEYAHVFSAKLLGEKVIKIQWLTYHGGTRVFLEHEPDYNAPVEKKWALISASGYLATNLLGYLLTLLYSLSKSIPLKRCLCFPAIAFLSLDCIYFVLGSVGNFGDIVGIRKTLRIPPLLSVLLSVCVLAANIFLILNVYY